MPELRKDPIVGRWVIISTERSKRPTDFSHSSGDSNHRNGVACVLCPGNEQMTPPEVLAYRDTSNGNGWHVRVVPNKFPALKIEGSMGRHGEGLYDMMNGVGAHE